MSSVYVVAGVYQKKKELDFIQPNAMNDSFHL